MGVEYFEGRLVGYLASMRIVTPQDIMYPRGVRLLLQRIAARLDDLLDLGQSHGEGIGDELLGSHQFLAQSLFPLFLLHVEMGTSFMELLSSNASRCL